MLAKNKSWLNWLLLVMVCGVAQAEEPDWSLKINRHDIQVYQQQREGFKQKHSKGVMTVNSHLAAVFALLADLNACSEWMFACLEARKHGDEFIYMIFDGPMWFKTRDMVIKTEVQLLRDTKQWLITITNHPQLNPDTEHVRVKQTTASWLLTVIDQTHTQIDYSLYLDPEVSFKTGVNKYVRDSVYLTLKSMRTHLQLPQYQTISNLPERIERILLESLNSDIETG